MHRQFPYDGPPLAVQELRLKPNRSRKETRLIREWVKSYKKRPFARPETIAAYSV